MGGGGEVALPKSLRPSWKRGDNVGKPWSREWAGLEFATGQRLGVGGYGVRGSGM